MRNRFTWGALAALLVAAFLGARALAVEPIKRGRLNNYPVTGGAAIFTSSLVQRSAVMPSAFRVTVAVSGTDSAFNLVPSDGSGWAPSLKFGSANLTAGNLYTFTFGADPGLSYNFKLTTSTTLEYLLVEEVVDGAL